MSQNAANAELMKADIGRCLEPRIAALLGRCRRLAISGMDLNLLHLQASEAADLARAARIIDAAPLAGLLDQVCDHATAALRAPADADHAMAQMTALLEQAHATRTEPDEAVLQRPVPVRNGFATASEPSDAELAHFRARGRRAGDRGNDADVPAAAPAIADATTDRSTDTSRIGAAAAEALRTAPAPVQVTESLAESRAFATAAPPAPVPTPAAAPTPAPPATAAPGTPIPASVPESQDVAIHFRNRGEFDPHVDTLLADLNYDVKHADDPATLARQLGLGDVRIIFSAEVDNATLIAMGEHIVATRRIQPHLSWIVAGDEDARLDQRRNALRAGADAFIATPVNETTLQQRLVELASDHSDNPYRVMIIDDDPSQAMLAETILQQAGMRTLTVVEPREALAQLDAFRPELILMDLYMPHCNGMELTALIRQHSRHAATPILFLSGADDADIQFEALNVGADGFLSKPMRPRHLVTAVRSHVRRARQLIDVFGQAQSAAATPLPEAPPLDSVANPQRMLDKVRHALESDGFRLAFQPILSLHGDDTAQFQALLRLRGRGDEDFTAAQVIAAAQPAGLMPAIDRWVLQRCAQVLATRRGSDRHCRLFVNQAMESLLDDNFAPALDALMQKVRLPPQALVVELPVADALDALGHAAELHQMLARHGIGLLLSGVTMTDEHLHALQQWNPRWLRVAGSYSRTEQAGQREELAALVRAAHADERIVAAPHVESARSTAMLWGAGVDIIQGHFVQEPGDDLDFDFRAATARHRA